MTTILVVEDDRLKADKLSDFLSTRFRNADIHEAQSYNSGLSFLVGHGADITVLDMSLPTYDIRSGEPGGRHRGYGGRDILEGAELYDASTRAIVVTQFPEFEDGGLTMTVDELGADLGARFPSMFVGIVHFDPTSLSWQSKLKMLVSSEMENMK